MSASKRIYSIPWQDSGSYRRGKYLLDTGIMADCSFMVGEGTQAKRFDCHKIILIAASPVFETMFCGSFKEARSNTVPINIPDATPDVFRIFLEFIYDPCQSAARIYFDETCSEYSDGEDYRKDDSDDDASDTNSRIDVLNEKFQSYDFDTLKNLLYLGNKYMIKSLGRQCCLALNQKLREGDEECILRIFELAVTTDHRGLARKSVQNFEQEFSLVATEVIYDLDASILCEFIKCLKSTPSREVLETIGIYIERNSLNVDADDVNEYEYSICKSCEQPCKRKRSSSSMTKTSSSSTSSSAATSSSSSSRQQKEAELAWPNVAENSKNDKHAHCSTKRGSSSGNGCSGGGGSKSHSSSSANVSSSSSSSSLSKKPRTDKANDHVEPTPSKSSSSNNCSHDSGLGNANNATSSTTNSSKKHNKPINAADKARNLEIIKQLYESVNFIDMDPLEFMKAAKKPGLAEYMSYRRKYEIMEKLVKYSQRNFCGYQRNRKWHIVNYVK